MIRAGLALALVATACGQRSSQLDRAFEQKPSAPDPWAAVRTGSGSSDDDKSGGFDLQGVLAKIKDSVDKPGYYEAPDHSPDYKADAPHWGVMKLHGDIVERESWSFTGGRGTELRQLIERLRELAKDDKLQGIVLRVGGVAISVPDVVELRAAMHAFRAANKQLICHTEGAANSTYLVLAACDKIGLAPLGEIAITGPAAMPIHVKGLLDKLGVEADFIHVGAYKGAAEPLTRDAPSKEMEETLGAILDRRYDTMVDAIAKDRGLDPAGVKTLIDTGLFPSEAAKTAKLVDDVAAFEAFRDGPKAPWTKLDLDGDNDKSDQLGAYLSLARFIGAMPPKRPIGDHVAVVYALGNIVDGSGDGLIGARQQIASQTLVPALHALATDASVKAVVLRIDSGGGSAQASELIWRAVAELKAQKPVIVSMSDVAASGGYYIASGATKIFALDDTLTGSIGVVGGRIAPAAALARIGVTTFPMGRGKHATMMASFQPWKPDEKAVIETTMKEVYTTFIGRVAAGRGKTPADIEPIAQGRVWTGTKAKQLGLVDAIGGLDAAVAEASKLAKVDATTDLEIYPPAPTLRDVIHGWGGVQTPLGLSLFASETALVHELDPQLAANAEQLLRLVMSFRTTAVQTIAIIPELR